MALKVRVVTASGSLPAMMVNWPKKPGLMPAFGAAYQSFGLL
jgi:hypothetical protein